MKFDSIVNKISNTYYNIYANILSYYMLTEKLNIEKSYINKIKIKGFRQGKVPTDILRFYYSKKIIKDTKEKIIKITLTKINTMNGISPIGINLFMCKKNIDDINNFEYEAKINTSPYVKIQSFNGKIIKRLKCFLSSQNIKYILNNIRKKNFFFKSIFKKGIKNGNYVNLSYSFYNNENNKIIRLLSKDNNIIKMEEFRKYSGLNEDLNKYNIESKIARVVKLSDTFYNKEFRNHLVFAKIIIFSIEVKRYSIMNDVFTKSRIFPRTTLILFKKKILIFLIIKKNNIELNYTYKKVVNYLCKKNKIVVPKILIEKQVNQLFFRYSKLKNLLLLRSNKQSIKNKIYILARQKIKEYLIIKSIINNHTIKTENDNISLFRCNSIKREIIYLFFSKNKSKNTFKKFLNNLNSTKFLNILWCKNE